MASTAIVAGSLQAIAERDGADLATVFTDADVLVIIDVSASMSTTDARGGRSRYTVACEELTKLQAAHPGKVAVISFNSDAQFCPGGLPPRPSMFTDLAGALDFAHVADGCGLKVILISDGEPDDEQAAMRAARKWQDKIDTIYVGPEGDSGQAFLRQLAKATGGRASADKIDDLADRIDTLLLTGGRP